MSLVVFAFLKCPLIGCTVTVSCFNCPLWYLNVAYLTLGWKPHIWQPKPMTVNQGFFFCFFFLCFHLFFSLSASVSVFNMSFEGDIFFTGGQALGLWKVKSARFQHLFIILTSSVFVSASLSRPLLSTWWHARPRGEASDLGSRGPSDRSGQHTSRFQLGCISTTERPERTVIPPWGVWLWLRLHYTLIPFPFNHNGKHVLTLCRVQAHHGRGCLPSL